MHPLFSDNSSEDPLFASTRPRRLIYLLAWREEIPRHQFKVVVGGPLSTDKALLERGIL